jgi:hypothetical protein
MFATALRMIEKGLSRSFFLKPPFEVQLPK